ncbi:MAG: NADPH:quinone oxidoreductase [marine bacterium B5-7]|nr:MAG: NADPH:quinone oxidoreductase [marine bacterium B5-7]
MRAWQINSNEGIDALELVERKACKPGMGEVCVRVRASSVNYRDLATIRDPASRNLPLPRIPNSDAAGEVIAIGEDVKTVAVGDRVTSCFFQDWEAGPCTPRAMDSALGGSIDGVLAEEVILSARGVVSIPGHLTYEEAATLPCAALTAWNALIGTANLKSGDTVLLLGTGGVSIFALQFAQLMGIRAIVTSSSDNKLTRCREMGAWQTINYHTSPDWELEVLKLTDNIGVDAVVEVGGAGTLDRSIAATRVAGTIALIGVLTGGQINPVAIMRKSIRLQGMYVGHRQMFESMNRAITMHDLKPVIHETFPFKSARDAFHAMEAAGHFGKLVITL